MDPAPAPSAATDADIALHLSPQEGAAAAPRLDRIIVDVSSLDSHGWASLIKRCTAADVTPITFRAPKHLLMRKSSYFCSLFGGDFRESLKDQVHITWDVAAFCCLLQCMCSEEMEISSLLMAPILEGILFFGVESAIHVVGEAVKRKDLWKWAPKLWCIANGMGQHSVGGICVETIAINFEDVMEEINLLDLPSELLSACLDHKQLTVTSEKSLCEIILNWHFYHQNSSSCLSENVAFSNEILPDQKVFSLRIVQKIRVLMLPLDFLLGSLYQGFSVDLLLSQVSAMHGHDKLVLLMEKAAKKEIAYLESAENEELSLRMTRYSVRIDLAGCQQISIAMLFHTVLRIIKQRGINDSYSFLKIQEGIQKALLNEVFQSSLRYFDEDWSRDLFLKNLCQVNLERCWRLDQESLVMWLGLVCPNLKHLNISHCPQLRINILPQIAFGCKSLETLDLSLYFVNPPVTLFGGYEVQYSCPRYRWYDGLLKCLTTISLYGRSSLADGDLKLIARCCPNISSVNLGGCCRLTDKGISSFLSNYGGLVELGSAYTAFGAISCTSLIQNQMFTSNGCMLANLNLEGCWNLEEDSVAKLMEQSSSLRNLNLGFTSIGDKTINSFRGSGLRTLNLQETQVSNGFGHILHQNPYLKVLNSRGCKEAIFPTSGDMDGQSVLAEGVSLRDLSAGWGFSDSTLIAWKSALYSLQSLTIGVGGILSESALNTLHEVCPLLEQLSLYFQAISEENISNLLRQMPKLRVLGLHYSLGNLPSNIVHVISSNLTSLSLDRGVPWMTDASISLLGERCKGLTHLSLIGCHLLTSRSFQKIVQMWPGIALLKLEECGSLHSEGGSCLFSCRALREVTLRHNGLGLGKGFAKRAVLELPLLESLSLDICDSSEQDFDIPPAEHRRLLSSLKVTRCKRASNSCWQGEERTVVVEWNDMRQRTTSI